jgi:hypothetical protein
MRVMATLDELLKLSVDCNAHAGCRNDATADVCYTATRRFQIDEFLWADFFRSRIKRTTLENDFDAAAKKAMKRRAGMLAICLGSIAAYPLRPRAALCLLLVQWRQNFCTAANARCANHDRCTAAKCFLRVRLNKAALRVLRDCEAWPCEQFSRFSRHPKWSSSCYSRSSQVARQFGCKRHSNPLKRSSG